MDSETDRITLAPGPHERQHRLGLEAVRGQDFSTKRTTTKTSINMCCIIKPICETCGTEVTATVEVQIPVSPGTTRTTGRVHLHTRMDVRSILPTQELL